jgi:hypothetical protein
LDYAVRHYPPKYPYSCNIYIPDEEIAEHRWAYDDRAKQIGSKNYLTNWISINLVASISWETWINLDPYMRRALELEVEDIIQKRESEVSKQRSDMEFKQAQRNTELKFLNTNGGILDRMIKS